MAEGAADIAAEPVVALWDLAPLLVIVEEAGGRFTDLAGNRTADGGSAVSTNGILHDDGARRAAPRDVVAPAWPARSPSGSTSAPAR